MGEHRCKVEQKAGVATLRAEATEAAATLRKEMTESVNSLRQEVAAAAQELKNEAERVRADAHTETEELRGELYEQRSKHARDLEAQAESFKGAIAEAVKGVEDREVLRGVLGGAVSEVVDLEGRRQSSRTLSFLEERLQRELSSVSNRLSFLEKAAVTATAERGKLRKEAEQVASDEAYLCVRETIDFLVLSVEEKMATKEHTSAEDWARQEVGASQRNSRWSGLPEMPSKEGSLRSKLKCSGMKESGDERSKLARRYPPPRPPPSHPLR